MKTFKHSLIYDSQLKPVCKKAHIFTFCSFKPEGAKSLLIFVYDLPKYFHGRNILNSFVQFVVSSSFQKNLKTETGPHYKKFGFLV